MEKKKGNKKEAENKKILTLEKPIEYKHNSKKSVIVQKEVGVGGDVFVELMVRMKTLSVYLGVVEVWSECRTSL